MPDPCRPCDIDDAVGSIQHVGKFLIICLIHSIGLHIVNLRIVGQQSEHGLFPKYGWDHGDSDVNILILQTDAEMAVLGQAAFRNV